MTYIYLLNKSKINKKNIFFVFYFITNKHSDKKPLSAERFIYVTDKLSFCETTRKIYFQQPFKILQNVFKYLIEFNSS